MGLFMLAHKQISFPQATTTTEDSSMSTTAQRSALNQPTDHDDKEWQHPGEFGRVTAWLDRSKRDLRMVKKVDGNPPSAIFKPRETMFINVPAIPTPAGMDGCAELTGGAVPWLPGSGVGRGPHRGPAWAQRICRPSGGPNTLWCDL